MKTLATILYSYFITRGLIDVKTTKSTIKEIRFVCPSNKLKVNKSNTDKVLDNEKTKTCAKVYKMTKKLGEKYCKVLISPADAFKLENIKKRMICVIHFCKDSNIYFHQFQKNILINWPLSGSTTKKVIK
jgi:hypothetical protein